MTEYAPIRSIFVGRINEFERTQINPIPIQILEISVEFQVLDAVKNMFNGIPISKLGWKRLIWSRAWELERQNWDNLNEGDKFYDLLSRATIGPGYSIWWSISDGSRTISPRTISPRTISPGQYPPGQYPPRTKSPRTISPRSNIPPDNIPPDNIPPDFFFLIPVF